MGPSDTVSPDATTTAAESGKASAAGSSVIPIRFTAPAHVSAVTLSTGREIRVESGTLTAPDDLTHDERRQIERAGFGVT